MKRIVMKGTVRCVSILGVALVVAARPAEAASRMAEKLDKPVTVTWKRLEVSVCLKDLSKIGRVSITLDPGLPRSVGETLVTYSGEDVPLCVALGSALREAGLRYAITEAGIFVSTRGRLARRLVYERQEQAPPESRPMTEQEALAELSRPVGATALSGRRGREREEEEAFTFGDPGFTIDCRPHRFQERPRYNPVTGLTDYPGPSIWLSGDDDRYTARFRYSQTPYFLRPEALEEEGLGRADREAVARILEIIRRYPDWFREKVLRELREEKR